MVRFKPILRSQHIHFTIYYHLLWKHLDLRTFHQVDHFACITLISGYKGYLTQPISSTLFLFKSRYGPSPFRDITHQSPTTLRLGSVQQLLTGDSIILRSALMLTPFMASASFLSANQTSISSNGGNISGTLRVPSITARAHLPTSLKQCRQKIMRQDQHLSIIIY